MEISKITIRLGTTQPGSRQFQSQRMDVTQEGILTAEEIADPKKAQAAWMLLRQKTKAKLLEVAVDAKEAAEIIALNK
tara:strand:- start:1399 stop:1632 length:234 start_codon:yes stop_codon:yes gene_type:complete